MTEQTTIQSTPIPVQAIFSTQRRPVDATGYIAHIPGFVANFQTLLMGLGTCILGSMIESEHFGMSRSLAELSKAIPLDITAGQEAAGVRFCCQG